MTTELWAFVRQLTEGAFAVSPKARQSECGSNPDSYRDAGMHVSQPVPIMCIGG